MVEHRIFPSRDRFLQVPRKLIFSFSIWMDLFPFRWTVCVWMDCFPMTPDRIFSRHRFLQVPRICFLDRSFPIWMDRFRLVGPLPEGTSGYEVAWPRKAFRALSQGSFREIGVVQSDYSRFVGRSSFQPLTPLPTTRLRGTHSESISHKVLIQGFQKVNSPTKSSTYCLLLSSKTRSLRLGGGVDFLKPFNDQIV